MFIFIAKYIHEICSINMKLVIMKMFYVLNTYNISTKIFVST